MSKGLQLLIISSLLVLIVADSEPQRENILFERVDKDLDGYLTRAELDAVFFLFDQNHDRIINKAEFDSDWTTDFKIGIQKEADVMFDKADTNDDGVIDNKDLPAIFHYFDKSGDGRVSIDEFLTQWGDLTLTASGTNTAHSQGTADPSTTVQFTFT